MTRIEMDLLLNELRIIDSDHQQADLNDTALIGDKKINHT